MNKKQIQRIERAVVLLRKVDEEHSQKSNRGKSSRADDSADRYLYAAIMRLEDDVLPLAKGEA